MKNFIKIALLILSMPALTQAQWSLTGNAATDTAVNFIGTTDAKGLKIKTNNLTRVYVDKGGKVGIGTTDPQTALDLYSLSASIAFGIRSDGGSAFIFMDKQNATDNSTVSYRTNGTAVFQSGTFGNNDYAIKNLPLGNSITCLSSNNFVGIGTASPTQRLDVNGNINTTGNLTATGTITATGGNSTNWNTAFGWGNHATAGYLTSFTETDPRVASTTINKVPRWSGTALLDGIITDNGTNIGIGTNIPSAKLDVKTTSNYVAQFNGTSPMYMGLFESDVYRGYLGSYSGAAEDVDFGTGAGNTTGKLHLTIQSNPKLTINPSGQVGIGTTSPAYLLHVNGGDLFVQSSSGLIRFGYQGANEWQLATTGAGADLRWYTTTNGGTTITPRHYFSQNGNVGIGGFSGSQTPIARLDVIATGATSSSSVFSLRNNVLDTIMRVRDDGRMGIGYNGVNYGRTMNVGGSGMNFYTSNEAAFGGAIFPTDTSLVIWSNLNSNNYLVFQPSWGNVGIGTYRPLAKLHINNGTTSSLTTGGFLLMGNAAASNLVFDNTSIMARNNSAAATLSINNGSGNVLICETGNGALGVGTATPNASFRATISDSTKSALLVGPSTGGLLGYMTLDKPASSNSSDLARFRDDGSSQVVIGLSSATYRITIFGSAIASGGTWTNSDSRIKSDVKDLQNVMPDLMKLRPASYYFKSKNEQYKYLGLPDELQFGLIAQEVKKVFPNIVHEDVQLDENGKPRPETLHSMNYTELIPVIIKGMQEQQKQIETKDARIENMQKEIDELKTVVNSCCQSSIEASQKAVVTEESMSSKLYQNQPNPFDAISTIKYSLVEKNAKAQIIIRALNGTIVKSFDLAQSGSGAVTVNANELERGTYTYSLIVNDKCLDTKLMVITK